MSRDPKEAARADGPSEFDYGPGMFRPGIADTNGPDFGAQYPNVVVPQPPRTHEDNYARAVADRRTDTTDPDSGRDFTTLGNPDRYGGQPVLIKATPPDTTPAPRPEGRPPLERKP